MNIVLITVLLAVNVLQCQAQTIKDKPLFLDLIKTISHEFDSDPNCPIVCVFCPMEIILKLERPILGLNSIKDLIKTNIKFHMKKNYYCSWILNQPQCDSKIDYEELDLAWRMAAMPMVFALGEIKSQSGPCRFKNPIIFINDLIGLKIKLEGVYRGNEEILNIWTPTTKFLKPINFINFNKRPQFHMKYENWTVSAIGTKPYIKYDDKGKIIGGVDLEIIKIFSKKYGFKYNVKKEQYWLKHNKSTGVYSGNIGNVHYGKSNIGVGHISIRHNRFQIIDYTTSLYPIATYLIARKPSPVPPFNNIFKTFNMDTWCALIGTIIGLVITFNISYNYSKKVHLTKYGRWHYISTPFVIVFSQNLMNKNFANYNSKILIIISLISLNFLVLAYKCNLRAKLMVVDYEKPIDSLEDVLKIKSRLFLPVGTVVVRDFETSPIPLYQRAYQEGFIERNGKFYITNGLAPKFVEDSMLVNRSAVVWPTPLVAKRDATMKVYQRDPFRIGNTEIQVIDTAFVMPKYNPYLRNIDAVGHWIRDMGIISKMVESLMNDFSVPEVKKEFKIMAFTVEHYFLITACFLIGIIAAFVLFIGEIGYQFMPSILQAKNVIYQKAINIYTLN